MLENFTYPTSKVISVQHHTSWPWPSDY